MFLSYSMSADGRGGFHLGADASHNLYRLVFSGSAEAPELCITGPGAGVGEDAGRACDLFDGLDLALHYSGILPFTPEPFRLERRGRRIYATTPDTRECLGVFTLAGH